MIKLIIPIAIIISIITTGSINVKAQSTKKTNQNEYSKLLNSEGCDFSTTGRNEYFILEPGYQLILEGKEGKNATHLVITVLKTTRKVGNVETRIVEENESVNGKTVEISRNYFAFCKQTKDIYYFGEEVDMYKNGKVVSHEGAWLAEGKNKPGIGMLGSNTLGAKYYQEVAPVVAMDRAEVVSVSETKVTPAGKFTKVLKTKETTPLSPLEKEFKLYAPGIGLIMDENLLLVKYGFQF